MSNKESQRRYRERHREELKQKAQEYNKTHKEEKREYDARYNLCLKLEVLTHYGQGRCACVLCRENHIRCLSIDHIEGGGTRRRQDYGGGGSAIYRWLKKHKFPKGYRTLCMNCQFKEAYRNG